MSDKFKIVSLSMKPDMEELLKSTAKSMKRSVSQLVRDLVENFLLVQTTHEEMLKAGAKRQNCTTANLLAGLIQRHPYLLVKNESEIPVILRVPADLKKNPAELKKWLAVRSNAVFEALTAKK